MPADDTVCIAYQGASDQEVAGLEQQAGGVGGPGRPVMSETPTGVETTGTTASDEQQRLVRFLGGR